MKLNIRIFLTRNKVNGSGKCPVRCRITYNKQRKEFSTGLFIYPKYWNSRKQRVSDDSENSEYINIQLSLIINKINQSFVLFQVQESNFTVDDVYTLYKGEKIKKEYKQLIKFNDELKELHDLNHPEKEVSEEELNPEGIELDEDDDKNSFFKD